MGGELRELHTVCRVSLFMKPDTEGVHRPNVGVARHRSNVSQSQGDDELLQAGFRGKRFSPEIGRVVLERYAIPQERSRGDVLQIRALAEELFE